MSDNQTLIKNATNATTETGIFGCPKYFDAFSPKNMGVKIRKYRRDGVFSIIFPKFAEILIFIL